MMRTPSLTLRDVGADLSRPRLTDRAIALLQRGADALSRRLWLVEYQRAERRYWLEQGEQHKCK